MSLQDLKDKAARAAVGEEAPETGKAEVATIPETGPEAAAEPKKVDHADSDETLLWLSSYSGFWRELLPDGINETQFNLAVWAALNNSERLAKTATGNPTSLIYSLAMCAHFGLLPDGVQAALVPVKQKVEFWPMYQGYIALMYRTGMIRSIVFDHIREGDEWSLDKGKPSPDDFSHKPDMLNEDGKELIAYTFAWMPNGHRSEVVWMNAKMALEVAVKYSRAYQNAEKERRDDATDFEKNPWRDKYSSPWHTNFLAMWLKTVVRLLAKRMDLTADVAQLVAADAADSPHGQQIVTPAEVTRVMTRTTLQAAVLAGDKTGPHAYVYDERTDPFCLECKGYQENGLHPVS